MGQRRSFHYTGELREPSSVINLSNLTFFSGDNGRGVVHHRYGYGEYLDVDCISQARDIAASKMGSNCEMPELLEIEELVLEGFIVDRLALQRWFNPSTLKRLDFVAHRRDAGLAIGNDETSQPQIITRPDIKQASLRVRKVTQHHRNCLKILTLQGGRVVRRVPQHQHDEDTAGENQMRGIAL